MTNLITGHITLASIADMKTTMQWFQNNYPTNLKLRAEGEGFRVDFTFTVTDLDAGIAAVSAILIEYPTAVWYADLE